MGLVEDISKVMRMGPELVGKVNSVKINTKSIARGAKDSTFQFPCLIVDTAPIDMANTIARTLDQVYATFTQTWLSMNSMFDMTIDPNPLSYLKRLHQNLKLESLEVPDEEVEDYMEKVYDGKYKLFMNEDKSYGVLFNVAEKGMHDMYESHKDLLRDNLSEFDLSPIMEADISANDVLGGIINSAKSEKDSKLRNDNIKATQYNKPPQMSERDIKKSNDLMPYGIQVRLIAVNDKKEFVQYVDFIVGVKTILHLVTSDDMVENIARAMQNKSLAFKLLKWTTGEISLFKDIIFNINDIKTDVRNSRDKEKSPFFNTLKRLKGKKFGVRNLTVPHAIIPNATIVITTTEADVLEKKYGIDVRNDRVANKLVKSLFLMSFIIMDEGTGTLSVLYDGDQTYQTYSLETLERDNSLNSNKLGREIGRMIAH